MSDNTNDTDNQRALFFYESNELKKHIRDIKVQKKKLRHEKGHRFTSFFRNILGM